MSAILDEAMSDLAEIQKIVETAHRTIARQAEVIAKMRAALTMAHDDPTMPISALETLEAAIALADGG